MGGGLPVGKTGLVGDVAVAAGSIVAAEAEGDAVVTADVAACGVDGVVVSIFGGAIARLISIRGAGLGEVAEGGAELEEVACTVVAAGVVDVADDDTAAANSAEEEGRGGTFGGGVGAGAVAVAVAI